MTKQKITILVANDSRPQEYIKFLERAYEINLITHKEYFNRDKIIDIDLILFTGGEDIDPQYYAEPVGKYTNINKDRDMKEKGIWNEFRDTNKLCICRGAQIGTVLSGGELVQHVTGHGGNHRITIEGMGEYEITSTHHQMMYPFNLPEDKYELIAHSTNFRSDTYLDGWNKEKELPRDFLESEIVYYPSTKALCIQGHPEMNHCPESTKDVCIHLINRYLKL